MWANRAIPVQNTQKHCPGRPFIFFRKISVQPDLLEQTYTIWPSVGLVSDDAKPTLGQHLNGKHHAGSREMICLSAGRIDVHIADSKLNGEAS